MLTHLLDTDICIYAMKGREQKLASRLEELSGHCAISDISLFELYAGAHRYDFPAKRLSIIEDFSNRLKILPFDSKAARIAGPIQYKLESEGQRIGNYDILIAATALSRNLVLISKNIREFNRVPGLQVEQWVS